MSIVEKAADKLRQSSPATARGAHDAHHAPGERSPIGSATARRPDPEQHRPVAAPSRLSIDFALLRRAGLAPPVAVEDTVAREYQRIKRPLLANVTGYGAASVVDGNRLMVASALSGEGKTFTSVNLALSLAKERDHSVLLVDGDVIKPSISRAFGLGDNKGLVDLLADDRLSLTETIVETDVPRLSFLPAGQRNPHMTELLSSQRMSWLTSELSRDPNRIVVFDSPPLLATTESQALAVAVGQIVVVVKAAATGQHAVEAALTLIDSPGKSVNLILNQSEKFHGDYYAGYYGGAYGESDIGT